MKTYIYTKHCTEMFLNCIIHNSPKVETTQMSILINDFKNVVNEELVHATSWVIEKCTRF